tara:strand:- start:8787 stop:9782 length:996 start_codon:yes stop_codon:yes gene_type:complete
MILLFLPFLWFIYEKSNRKTFKTCPGIGSDNVEITNQEWVLYHNNFSLCSRKIRIALAEYNISYQSKHINLIETGNYETLSRKFLKINPQGTVPVLLHFGRPVYESHEQLLYLAENLKTGGKLMPTGDKDLSDMKYWINKGSLKGKPDENLLEYAGNCVALLTPPLFTCMISYVPLKKIIIGLLFHPIKQRAIIFLVMKALGVKLFQEKSTLEAVIIKSFEIMNRHLNDLEILLANHQGEWIIPDQYTLADVSWITILHRLEELKLLRLLTNKKKNVANYYNKAKKRLSFNEAIINHSHPILEKGLKDLDAEITGGNLISSMYEKLKEINV